MTGRGASARLRAETAWARECSTNWWRQHVDGDRRILPCSTRALFDEVAVLGDQVATMRDGVRLLADVYLPSRSAARGSLPTILIRMPYGKRAAYCYMPAHGRFWAQRGYACVIQDVRGRHASEGAWEPYDHEADDGWDTLDWVVGQPWCDGNVGMVGESYYGSTQWAVAPLGHPNLRALAPGDVDHDFYNAVHDGGALCLATAAVWAWEMRRGGYRNHYRFAPWHLPLSTAATAAGRRAARYQMLIEHPSRDSFWDRENEPLRYESITIPMLHWGGWYDVHVNGTLDGWRRVRECSASATARAQQWVMMGATDHELSPEFTGMVGRTPVRDHGYAHDRLCGFMDRFVKGDDTAFAHDSPVLYHTVGDRGWRNASDWPPPTCEDSFFNLHSHGWAAVSATDGVLDRDEPGDEAVDTFVYDPADPVEAWLGRSVWEAAKTMIDRSDVEARCDVLVYTSASLDAELDVTGPIRVHLFAASSARDTDFTAALVDVFPDGFAQLVREGIVRARYRDSDREASLIEPGEVYEYTIDLGSTSYCIARGHRLRLELSSSNFDRYDRNLNTGGIWGHEANYRPAQQRVFHDRGRPSRLVLSVASR